MHGCKGTNKLGGLNHIDFLVIRYVRTEVCAVLEGYLLFDIVLNVFQLYLIYLVYLIYLILFDILTDRSNNNFDRFNSHIKNLGWA